MGEDVVVLGSISADPIPPSGLGIGVKLELPYVAPLAGRRDMPECSKLEGLVFVNAYRAHHRIPTVFVL